jgi:hypothetical protein
VKQQETGEVSPVSKALAGLSRSALVGSPAGSLPVVLDLLGDVLNLPMKIATVRGWV